MSALVGTTSSLAGLPFRRRPAGVFAGSVAAAALLTAASVVGLVAGASAYEGSPSALVSPGGDTANLLLAVPALLACLWAVRRGSRVGLLLWPGALFCALYISAIYLLAGPYGLQVIGHLGVVVVEGCCIVAVLASIDLPEVCRMLAAAPARAVGSALIVIALLAYAGLAANPGSAAELGYRGQWAVDAGLGTPVLLIGGLLLWRRSPPRSSRPRTLVVASSTPISSVPPAIGIIPTSDTPGRAPRPAAGLLSRDPAERGRLAPTFAAGRPLPPPSLPRCRLRTRASPHVP